MPLERRMKRAIGPPEKCICPNCSYEEAHKLGERCSGKKCPKCGTRMMGKW